MATEMYLLAIIDSSSSPSYVLDRTEEYARKKRKRASENMGATPAYDGEIQSMDRFHDPSWDGCTTPSTGIFTDVNWELGKLREL